MYTMPPLVLTVEVNELILCIILSYNLKRKCLYFTLFFSIVFSLLILDEHKYFI